MKHGWDGEWFLRAYDDFGKRSEVRRMKKVRYSLNPKDFVLWVDVE